MITLTLFFVLGLAFLVLGFVFKLLAGILKIAFFPVKIIFGIVFGIIGFAAFICFSPLAIFLFIPAVIAFIIWAICKAAGAA